MALLANEALGGTWAVKYSWPELPQFPVRRAFCLLKQGVEWVNQFIISIDTRRDRMFPVRHHSAGRWPLCRWAPLLSDNHHEDAHGPVACVCPVMQGVDGLSEAFSGTVGFGSLALDLHADLP